MTSTSCDVIKPSSTVLINSPSSSDVINITINTTNNSTYTYRKPKWWKTLAGRRGTKGQRATISRMTDLGYVIPKLDRYRHHIKVSSELFGVIPRGVALTADRVLYPKDVADINEERENTEEKEERLHDGNPPADSADTDTSLEIGFGPGDNLLTNAMHFPQRNYIGAEIHQPGVGIVLGRMEKAVQDGQYWKEQTLWRQEQQNDGGSNIDENDDVSEILDDGYPILSSLPKLPSSKMPYDNVRIYPGDGMKLLQFLPSSSLNSMYLTHPDPWPKPGQSHWRVIQEETVQEIGRVLKPGIGCFYLATDAECFDEWTRMVFGTVNERIKDKANANGDSLNGESRLGGWEEVLPCPDRREWLPVVSKYEGKGMDEGRLTTVQCWRLLL